MLPLSREEFLKIRVRTVDVPFSVFAKYKVIYRHNVWYFNVTPLGTQRLTNFMMQLKGNN